MNLECIKLKLSKMLPPERINHSIRVADCAVKLSKLYGCDINKAYTAGLVHDCAKYINDEEADQYVNKYNIELDKYEKNNIALSHSLIGATIAKNEFCIDDKEVISSIRYHTTGKMNMSLLEKIIYIADLIEEGRNFPNVDKLRSLAYGKKIDKALLLSFDDTIKFVIQRGQIIHPRTIEARNYILCEINYN